MRSLEAAALSRRERSSIDGALAADPALAGELELIAEALDSAAGERFWRALADECPRHRRPAAAVLAALTRAAGG